MILRHWEVIKQIDFSLAYFTLGVREQFYLFIHRNFGEGDAKWHRSGTKGTLSWRCTWRTNKQKNAMKAFHSFILQVGSQLAPETWTNEFFARGILKLPFGLFFWLGAESLNNIVQFNSYSMFILPVWPLQEAGFWLSLLLKLQEPSL